MKRFLKVSMLGLGGLFLMTSCATIISGTTQKIHVKTTPPGKEYTIDVEGEKHKAPSIIEVKRSKDTKTIRVEECPTEEEALKPKLNIITLLNIISGGGIGLTTDYLSGALWEYEPSEVTVGCPSEEK